MPFRDVTIRAKRGELVLVVLFALAITSVATAIVARSCVKPTVYHPLQVPAELDLSNGIPGTMPPQIAAGSPLVFSPQAWCNDAGHELIVRVSITLATIAKPTTTVPVLSGFGYLLPKGCTSDHGLNFKPAQPLTPGMWYAEVTISANEDGHTQIVSVTSKPFQVVSGSP